MSVNYMKITNFKENNKQQTNRQTDRQTNKQTNKQQQQQPNVNVPPTTYGHPKETTPTTTTKKRKIDK